MKKQMRADPTMRVGANGAQPQTPTAAPTAHRSRELAAKLLKRLFHKYPGVLHLRLWDGTSIEVGAQAVMAGASRPQAAFSLVFRNPNVVADAVLARDPLVLADAYFRGDLDIEGDFLAALQIKDHLDAVKLSLPERLTAMFTALRLRAAGTDRTGASGRAAVSAAPRVKAHSKAENRSAIQFHYDVSNEFYALWLDRAMVYSCAYFEDVGVGLDDAQTAKLDHICRKLLLNTNERFLDIGCGWGALVIHAAKHYGVQAHGVTLSPHQLAWAKQRIAEAGLEDRVTVELLDYRDLAGESVYDKIASIGMFEHVGLKNLPIYFATVQRLLKPRGLFLNHGITHDGEGWQGSLSTEFINRYVFPDGQLDNISNVQREMERAKFEIADVEALRPHYALTLRQWVSRLEANYVRALQHVNEATFRVWRLYMSACALDFEGGDIGIYQVLASKRAPGPMALRLTRRHLYAQPSA